MMTVLSVLRRLPVAFLIALLVPSAARANVPLLQISSDPFTNPTSQHATEVEPDTFASGSTIVATFQAGRFVSGGGASGIGWATSTDGGANWIHASLPGITKFAGDGPYDRATDSTVAYDADHGVWLISSLALHEATGAWDVLVSRSTDGGLSWGDPVTVALGPDHGSLDKPWIVCDNTATSPFYGHCYVQWTDFPGACSQHVELSTSTDGGLTWGPVETPANTHSATGGQPLVQPNGTVIVPITGGCNQNSLLAFRSLDGGASWSAIVPITPIRRHVVVGLRGGKYVLPSAEIDAGGTVYVAWQDCRFRRNCSSNDIVFSSSTDGLNWSPVSRVPIDGVTSTVDHFIPGLAVDRSTSGASTHLGLAYYFYPQADCDVSTCELDVGFVSSTNAGKSWGGPTQLAGPMTLNWLANTSAGRFVGDYISTSFTTAGTAYPVIAVAHAPSGDLFDEAMYTPMGGLAAMGGTAVASSGGVVFTGTTTQSPPRPSP
jgi:BNR repeat-like domain